MQRAREAPCRRADDDNFNMLHTLRAVRSARGREGETELPEAALGGARALVADGRRQASWCLRQEECDRIVQASRRVSGLLYSVRELDVCATTRAVCGVTGRARNREHVLLRPWSAWSAWYRGTVGPVEADLKDRPVLTVSECLYRRRL